MGERGEIRKIPPYQTSGFPENLFDSSPTSQTGPVVRVGVFSSELTCCERSAQLRDHMIEEETCAQLSLQVFCNPDDSVIHWDRTLTLDFRGVTVFLTSSTRLSSPEESRATLLNFSSRHGGRHDFDSHLSSVSFSPERISRCASLRECSYEYGGEADAPNVSSPSSALEHYYI